LQGFVPQPVIKKVEDLCENRKIVYLKAKVKPTDEPPILLRNNRFASLFEPLGQLYSLPSYGELDMTPFFAPFFMLFFGFCLGDAGYGIVILISTFIFKNKVAKEWKPVLILARYLSLTTILFGILTGTLFGINLLTVETPWLRKLQNVMIDSNQAFSLALLLGLAQILFGLVLKAFNNYRQFGIKYSIGPIAWMILILSLTDNFVSKLTGDVSFYLSWIGVILILFFSNPEGNIFKRVGQGVWELYGITGLVGDLLSYIRLFALGISGAILGMVINDIALRLLQIDYVGWLIFIIFLVIGHTANLLIASLGSFVHPLRLTFVEFYKNAGFSGGGTAYKPLERQKGNT
jgi:V/A-type H+/Na+-transporting ATPase subunit I